VDLGRFLEDFVDQGLDAASLVVEDDGVRLSGGLRAAYAFNEWSGLTGSLEAGYVNTVLGTDGGVLAGLTASLDFGQKGGTPIGLMLSGAFDSLTLQGDNVGNTFNAGGGVFYTGREDFSLGLEFFYSRTPLLDSGVNLNATVFNVTTRYYF
jgi:hypothetical protein